jgi:hypothetical protein
MRGNNITTRGNEIEQPACPMQAGIRNKSGEGFREHFALAKSSSLGVLFLNH